MAKLSHFRSKKEQDELISQEVARLTDIINIVHPAKQRIAKKLIDNIAFMAITLEDLQEVIKSQGPIINFEQGSQKMLVENPAQKSYSTLMNRFNTSIKQLFDILPKDLVDMLSNSSEKSADAPQDALKNFMQKYS